MVLNSAKAMYYVAYSDSLSNSWVNSPVFHPMNAK